MLLYVFVIVARNNIRVVFDYVFTVVEDESSCEFYYFKQ